MWRCERCEVAVTGTRCPTCGSMPDLREKRIPLTDEVVRWLQFGPGGLGPQPVIVRRWQDGERWLDVSSTVIAFDDEGTVTEPEMRVLDGNR